MRKIRYPDNVIRSRRQSIEVAKNLEVWADGDEFVLELFKDEHSTHKTLSDALDEAACLILGDEPVCSVRFSQTDGVWSADMDSLHASLYAWRKNG